MDRRVSECFIFGGTCRNPSSQLSMAEGSKTACDPVLFLSLCAPGWRQPWIFSGRMKAARRGAGWPDNATPSWVCCRIAVSRWSLTDQRGNGDTPAMPTCGLMVITPRTYSVWFSPCLRLQPGPPALRVFRNRLMSTGPLLTPCPRSPTGTELCAWILTCTTGGNGLPSETGSPPGESPAGL